LARHVSRVKLKDWSRKLQGGLIPAVPVPLFADGKIHGPAVHDARIAALCLTHGVQALWTADRDFGRFPRLRTVNPLI